MRTPAAPKMGDDLFVFPSSAVHQPNHRHPICTLKPRVSESKPKPKPQPQTQKPEPKIPPSAGGASLRRHRVRVRYFSWTSGVQGCLLRATQNRDSAHDLCERRTAPPLDWTKPQNQLFGMTRAFHDPSRDFPDNSNKQFFCGSPRIGPSRQTTAFK